MEREGGKGRGGSESEVSRAAPAIGKRTLTEGLVQRKPEAEGAALPGPVRGRLEGAMGVDLGAVRVHTGEDSARAAADVGAQAFAVGQDIHFGAEKYDPGSTAGQHLLAHEVAHTVQQRHAGGAGAQPKLEVGGTGDAAEREADAVADAVIAGHQAPAIGAAPAAIRRQPTALERDFAAADATHVYEVRLKSGERLPVLVYLPSGKLDKTQPADLVLFFHGDAADYKAHAHSNMRRESPAVGADLPHATAGAGNMVLIAPQVSQLDPNLKAVWQSLKPGDFQHLVNGAISSLEGDLGHPIKRGAYSLIGHSGGGKALGQAAADLEQDPDAGGVTDITVQEGAYWAGENAAQVGDGSFANSFQLIRSWMLDGKPGKILRVITIEGEGGGTRSALEDHPQFKLPAGHKDYRGPIGVLSRTGLQNAIAAKGKSAVLEVMPEEHDTTRRLGGGMQLLYKVPIVHKADHSKVQGTIYLFKMANDTHFGARNHTMAAAIHDRKQGDGFGVTP